MSRLMITVFTTLLSGVPVYALQVQNNFDVDSKAEADQILGIWKTTDPDGKSKFLKKEGLYLGKIIYSEEMFEPDGETLTRDVNNPVESLRDRIVQDLIIITDFEYEDGEWTGGEIYDPQNGRTHRGRMRIEDGDLHLRGYISVALFGRTEVWERVKY